MHERGDEWDIADFDEWVGWGLEEDEFEPFGVSSKDGREGGERGGCVEVVHGDARVGREVFEQPVGTPVEVVPGDDVVPGGEKPCDYIHGGHAGGDDEASVGGGDFGEVPLEVAPCGVARPGVVVGAVCGV